MNRVVSAIESGRCVIGVGSHLLRNSDVMLEISRRAALPTVALSGPATAPVKKITPKSLARATGQEGGVVVLVEPESADSAGLAKLGKVLKEGAHTPTVLVVARAFNPFQMGAAFSGVPVAHLKGRGNLFFRDLPQPPAGEELPQVELVKAKKSGPEAPHVQMVGREEELEALKGLLGEGGPLVISGPAGIGRRWLAESAVGAAELTRLPDLTLGWGCEADTLLARLAALGESHGQSTLADTLKKKHTPAEAVSAAIATLQACEGAASQAMIVHELNWAIGREGDFFRKGRLEMLIEALLTNTYPLRLIFTSTVQPVFYTEGQAATLRRFPVEGIKGRFLHDIFEGYKAPEFSRDKYGPMNDVKLHGHPMAARTYAVAVRERGVELVDDPKFLKLTGIDDTEGLRKRIHKAVDKCEGEARRALGRLAHLRSPEPGQFLASQLGIGRKGRIELLSAGLLDMVPAADGRRYHVHPLVRSGLKYREVSDFDIYGRLSGIFGKRARDGEGVERIAAMYESSRLSVAGRHFRDRIHTPFPDNDPDRDSILGLVRGKNPNFGLATTKVNEALKHDPSNSELWLVKAEILRRDNAKPEAIIAVYEEAFAAAAVPELFHDAVGFHLQRRQRKAAIVVLEQGVQALPDQPRLKTRLAALLMREGRRPEAIELLKTAMEQAPMLPDAYGIMGMLKRDEGAESLDDAETLLREAVRLAPNDAVQVSRLADLLAHKARTAPEAEAEALRAEARELLDPVLKDEKKAPEAHLLLARLVREEGKDLERAIWLLKKVKKQSDRSPDRKTRVAIEFARVDLARGDLDAAEATIRGLADKDPSNHAVFSTLSQVLEARQLYIPAHAEMLRAKERAPKGSLWAQQYDGELARMQALIEAGAGMMAAPVAEASTPAAKTKKPEQTIADIGASGPKVIRRKADAEPVAEEPAEAAAEEPAEAAAEEPAEAVAEEPAEVAADVEAALAPPSEEPAPPPPAE